MNIRPARPTDVPHILALLNEHVRRGDVLPRTADSIRDTLPDWLVGVDEDGDLVACVSLLFYTAALAEVRSLAVDDKVKGQGWGRTIVKALLTRAKQRGVPTVFALTRAVGFFQKMGFAITQKERFPLKVFRDCLACPLFEACDETAVVLHLNPADPKQTIPLPVITTNTPPPATRNQQPATNHNIKHFQKEFFQCHQNQKSKKQSSLIPAASIPL